MDMIFQRNFRDAFPSFIAQGNAIAANVNVATVQFSGVATNLNRLTKPKWYDGFSATARRRCDLSQSESGPRRHCHGGAVYLSDHDFELYSNRGLP